MTDMQGALDEHLDGSSDFDMWNSMREATELPNIEAPEYAVKRATYSAVYGAKEYTIKHIASKEIAGRSGYSYPDRSKVEGILEHEVVREVLGAPRNASRQISYHDHSDPHTKNAIEIVETETDRLGVDVEYAPWCE